MKFRKLGKTKMKVSEIGFGMWAIGGDMWGRQDDKDSVDALKKSLELGCNFFDTALAYGNGHSEKILGQVMKEEKILDDVIIATKVPTRNGVWSPPSNVKIEDAFPSEWIRESCEISLKNLGRNYIDVLQLHTWSKSWSETEWFDEMKKLKDEGKIRAIGISVSPERPAEANEQISENRVETIQTVYNILDQNPEEKLFPSAKKFEVGIIARVPYAEGILTAKFTKETKFSEDDWRKWRLQKNLPELINQVEKIKEITGEIPLHDAALKFCLSRNEVSIVIPGARNKKQAEQNFSVSESEWTLNKNQLDGLRKLWKEKEIGGITFA